MSVWVGNCYNGRATAHHSPSFTSSSSSGRRVVKAAQFEGRTQRIATTPPHIEGVRREAGCVCGGFSFSFSVAARLFGFPHTPREGKICVRAFDGVRDLLFFLVTADRIVAGGRSDFLGFA